MKLVPAEPDYPSLPVPEPALPPLDINAVRKGLFSLLSPVLQGRQGSFVFPADVQSDPRFPAVLQALEPDIKALGLTIEENNEGVSVKDPSNKSKGASEELPGSKTASPIKNAPMAQGAGRLGAGAPKSLMQELGSSPGLMSRL